MQIEITSLYNLEVYTQKGLYLGRISEILVDLNKYAIHELVLSETNPNIVEDSRSIGIPFRWIKSISEIVVLKYFPGKIHIKAKLQRYRQKRRKLRVLKKRGEHGVSRLPWRAPKRSRRRRA